MRCALRGLVTLLLMMSAPLQAAPPDPLAKAVGAGALCLERLDYPCALDRFTEALALQPDEADQGQRLLLLEALRGLAFTLVALNQPERAKATFRRALVLDPRMELDEAVISPRIVAVFRETQRDMERARVIIPPPEPPVAIRRPMAPPAPPALPPPEPEAQPEALPPLELELDGGLHALTGRDADDFEPGFTLGFMAAYRTTSYMAPLITLRYSQHAIMVAEHYGAQGSANLGVLWLAGGARLSVNWGPVELSAAPQLGLALFGIANPGEQAAFLAMVDTAAQIVIARRVSLGAAVIPAVITTAAGSAVSSFSVVTVMRFRLYLL